MLLDFLVANYRATYFSLLLSSHNLNLFSCLVCVVIRCLTKIVANSCNRSILKQELAD